MNSFAKVICVQCKVYYGSEERNGMCSVCFKEFKNKEPIKIEKLDEKVEVIPEKSIPITTENNMAVDEIKINEEVKETPPIRPVQTNPHACWICRLKVGYSGFKCKCGYIYCGSHRHFSAHNCDFDYKSYDREKLVKKGNHFGETSTGMSK